ncbi:fungal specific transcription factor domain-containing protein [Ascosphaera apis ARSEF 7405]|uniref:C6 finger domain transcription factor nscR n=1 Tax=Ascosphaera apis ARSEF 7405 TaxID=392613 RepID=A0A167YZM1_9EURO|nr:fungal specific transcription factor domain-containing protein [Ascosphaera apis ARSEF 7405]
MTSSHGAQPSFASLDTSASTTPSPTGPVALSPEQSIIAAEPEPHHDGPEGIPSGRGGQPPATAGRRKSADRVGEPARIRRRNRMITSCLECRRRKLKCDRSHPCSNCAKASRECLFLAPALDPTSRMKLTELKDKMGTLERTLEWDMVGRARAGEEFHPDVDTHKYGSLWGTQDEAYFPVPDDEKNLQPNPLAVPDVGYDDENDDDEAYDLGFKLGKLRITDRLGGFVRPRITDELTAVLSDLSFKEEGFSQIVQPPSKPPRLESISPEEKAIYFSPSSTFTAPRSEIIMGPQRPYSVRDYLPSQVVCDLLFRHYMEAVHFAAKIVHRPTFEKQYRDFCSMVCQEMHRILYIDRLRIDKKQISLLAVLSNIESFKKAMEIKYGSLVDVPNPTNLQRVARLTMSLLILRCYVIVLHRYHTSPSTPDRLRQLNLVCGAEQLEQAIELETDPTLKPWHWLSSAINLNHISLLLLADVYIHPMRKEADRLFRSFDYIFEVPPNLREPSVDGPADVTRHDLVSLRNAKARHILQQFRDRFTLYLQARKLKVPNQVSSKPLPRPAYDDGEDLDDPNMPSNSLLAKIKEEYTRKGKPNAPTRARAVTTSAAPYPSITAARATAMPPSGARRVSLIQQPALENKPRPDDSKVNDYFASQTTGPQMSMTSQPPIAVEMNMLSLSTPSTEVAPSYPPYNSAVQPPRGTYGPPYATPQSRPQGSSGNSSVSSPEHFNAGQGLWFLPGVTQAGAGVASTVHTPGGFAHDMLLGLNNNNNGSNGENNRQVPVQGRPHDLPMSDIDWSEWDKLFPPDVNNGDINLPLLTTEATTSSQYNNDPAVMFGTTTEYPQYNYPYMQPNMQQQQGQS